MQKPPALENVAELLPLSPAQSGMLFETLARGAEAYHAVLHVGLTGPLDAASLRAAFEAEVAAHEMCRACFVWEGVQQPVQVIRQMVDLPFEEVSGDPADWMEVAMRHRFDLAQAPLMRVWLVREDATRHRLIWACHHIISDAWSAQVMLERVMARLAGDTPPEAVAFSRHLRWLSKQYGARDAAYWEAELAGFEGSSLLPLHKAGAGAEAGHGHISQSLPPALCAAVRAAARAARVTQATLLSTAWALTLARLNGRMDVLFGEGQAGRPATQPGIEAAVGPFVTTAPARFRLSVEMTVADLLAQAEQAAHARRAHGHVGLSAALAAGGLQQQSSFDTLFVMQEPAQTLRAGDLEMRVLESRDQTSFPLAVLASLGERITLEVPFDRAALREQTVQDILTLFAELLDRLCTQGDARLADVLAPGMLAIDDGPAFAPLPQVIRARAMANPDAEALVAGETRLSYGALDARACGVADALVAKGIGKGDIVPVAAGRGAEALIGMLGALYAGAAYAPLDLSYPEARIKALLHALAPRVLLTDGTDAALPRDIPRIDLCSIAAGNSAPVEVSSEDLAYVIFTSGSSGVPKGVRISHGNLSWSTHARDAVYGAGPRAFLHLSSFAFDSSIVGIYWTLAKGGKLIVAPPRAEQDMARLMDLAVREAASHLLCLPALYDRMLEHARPDLALETVILAGEALSAGTLAGHRAARGSARLFNEYGPTEAAVWCAAYDTDAYEVSADKAGPVPIGKAPPGARLDVCDSFGVPLPDGVEGELVVRGAGVSPGYLNAPRAEEAAFGATGGTRFYRTGDRGVRLASGDLAYLGRMDAQVKIRGHRVEPGEIAAVLQQLEKAEAAVVVAYEANAPSLVAAVVSTRPVEEIRAGLHARLPAYMLPDHLVTVAALPRLPNGKLDRLAIAGLRSSAPRPRAKEAGAGFHQDTLVRIWESVLKQPVDAQTSFFASGGDSLKSIAVLTKATAAGLLMQPSDIFNHPRLGDLAAHLAERDRKPLELPEHYRTVATLNSSGTRTPFFMLHGSPEIYAALAATLGPAQPLACAFSAYRGGMFSLGQSIEDMAREAVDALRAWKPEGPYAIGGYSLGGAIALEMAAQLHNDGAEVQHLILLDPAPRTPPPRSAAVPLAKRLGQMRSISMSFLHSATRLGRYRLTGHEHSRQRYIAHAYRLSLLRYRPPVLELGADVFTSLDTPEHVPGIAQALPNQTQHRLAHRHLAFQNQPEAISAWVESVYTLLSTPKGES